MLVILIALAASGLYHLPATLGQDGPATGILALGEVLPQECPLFAWFRNEPGFFLTLIPTKVDFVMLLTLEESRRLVRLYFPRTRHELQTDYGFLAFVDTDLLPLTSERIGDLKAAVGEGGLSAFASLGGGVFTFNYGMWASSSLADVFPHDFLQTSSGQLAPSFRVEVNRRDDLPPVLTMLIPVGIESVAGKTWGEIYPRTGSTTWGWIKPFGSPELHPFLVSMPSGAGDAKTWAIADDLDAPWWSSVYEPSTNEYAQDVFLNIVHHSLGHRLPGDIITTHAVRIRFTSYDSWRAAALGTFEFLEKFGAQTSHLFADLSELDGAVVDARGEYARQEYQTAAVLMDHVIERTIELDGRAIESKNRTLLWVYATEWLAITGTLLTAGVVLHSLMVRRSLYRVSGGTRFGTPP
jgi:hypothetical protein